MYVVPFLMYYYTRLIAPVHVAVTNDESKTGHSSSTRLLGIWDYVQDAIDTPFHNKVAASLAGVAVAMGFFFFFTAVNVLSSTVSFAVSNCAPLVTIFIDVVFFHRLKYGTVLQIRFLVLACLFFVCAVCSMVLAEEDS